MSLSGCHPRGHTAAASKQSTARTPPALFSKHCSRSPERQALLSQDAKEEHGSERHVANTLPQVLVVVRKVPIVESDE